jgi:hypothetical protein
MGRAVTGGGWYEKASPRCDRCGAETADRFYMGFIDGEVYCSECLTPEQIEMILGFASEEGAGS